MKKHRDAAGGELRKLRDSIYTHKIELLKVRQQIKSQESESPTLDAEIDRLHEKSLTLRLEDDLRLKQMHDKNALQFKCALQATKERLENLQEDLESMGACDRPKHAEFLTEIERLEAEMANFQIREVKSGSGLNEPQLRAQLDEIRRAKAEAEFKISQVETQISLQNGTYNCLKSLETNSWTSKNSCSQSLRNVTNRCESLKNVTNRFESARNVTNRCESLRSERGTSEIPIDDSYWEDSCPSETLTIRNKRERSASVASMIGQKFLIQISFAKHIVKTFTLVMS